MADKLFEAPPRNEAQIIQAALRSGNFLRDAPSTRAALVRHMVDDGPGASFRWLLHTADAHELYARFGFDRPDRTFLERPAR